MEWRLRHAKPYMAEGANMRSITEAEVGSLCFYSGDA